MSTFRVWSQGLFKTQAELAVAENSDEGSVSRAIRVGKLFADEGVLKATPDIRSITMRTCESALTALSKVDVGVLANAIAEAVAAGKTTGEEALRIAAMRCKSLGGSGSSKTKSGSSKARNVRIGLGRSMSISATVDPSGAAIAKFPKGAINATEEELLVAVRALIAEMKPAKQG